MAFRRDLLVLVARFEIGKGRLRSLAVTILEARSMVDRAEELFSETQVDICGGYPPVYMILTLPRTADSTGKVTSDLRSSREEWRRNYQRRGERENICCRTTVSANVIFVGSKLSTLRGNTLKVFLSRCIRIANLQ